jgi:hypothetical protein
VNLTTHLHLVPRSKDERNYTSIPQYVFMAWCLVKHRDKFTFYLLSFGYESRCVTFLFMSAVEYLLDNQESTYSIASNFTQGGPNIVMK